MMDFAWTSSVDENTQLSVVLPPRVSDVLEGMGVCTLRQLSELLLTSTPAAMTDRIGRKDLLLVIYVARYNELPHDKSLWDTWFYQYTTSTEEGRRVYAELQRGMSARTQSKRARVAQGRRRDEQLRMRGVAKRAKSVGAVAVPDARELIGDPISVKDIGKGIRKIDPREPPPSELDPKIREALENVGDEAEQFMLTYFRTPMPFDPVVAALKVGRLSQEEVDRDPARSKDRATQMMLFYRDKLASQHRLEGVRRRAGLDMPGTRDLVLKSITGALMATTPVIVKLAPEGFNADDTDLIPVAAVMTISTNNPKLRGVIYGAPDHRSRTDAAHVICKQFGISFDDLKGLGNEVPVKNPANEAEAIDDLIDTIIRVCQGLNVTFDAIAVKVKKRLSMGPR